jgi:hypothetical protein
MRSVVDQNILWAIGVNNYICVCNHLHKFTCTIMGSRNSSVGIATGYGLDDREVGIRVPVWSKCSLLRSVQTGSGAHPASYPMGTGGSSPGGKAAEA